MLHYNTGIFTTTPILFDAHQASLFAFQQDLCASTLFKSLCAPASSLVPGIWAHFLGLTNAPQSYTGASLHWISHSPRTQSHLFLKLYLLQFYFGFTTFFFWDQVIVGARGHSGVQENHHSLLQQIQEIYRSKWNRTTNSNSHLLYSFFTTLKVSLPLDQSLALPSFAFLYLPFQPVFQLSLPGFFPPSPSGW